MPDLLLELLSEEIPSRFQRKAAGELKKRVTDGLVDAGLTYEAAGEYWTPRRLVLDIRGLTAKSADVQDERKGPRTDAPEKAIEGFLRGAGLKSADEAEVRNDPKKGDFYVAVIKKPGRNAEEIISEIMPEVIRTFPWPKSMRWGDQSAQSGSLKWVRPLQSILCTFGPETEEPEIVPFEIGGVSSGNTTCGHRFHSPKFFTVKRFDDYVAKLEKAHVMLDADRRKQFIATDAKNLAFAQGLELVEDEGLLEEVAGLVEWPVVLTGEYEKEFLDIPAEVVQLTIRENQKCFVLRDAKSGKLTNKFILVANIEASDGGVEIAKGNGKVVRARLSDAKFFWESDLAVKLDDLLPKLDNVTFHAKLGTQGERVQRIVALAEELAPIVGADVELAKRAATLAKADLNSAMVYEFPEMQGKIGRVYAEKAGENASVALAIEEHYKPQGPSDDVPTDPVSVTVALADKLDTLVGFWAIDEKPTGSKDPFALRRAALGVIRLIIENDLRLPIILLSTQAQRRLELQKLEKFKNAKLPLTIRELGESRFARVLTEPNLSKKVFDDFVEKTQARIDQRAAPQPIELALSLDPLAFFHDRLKVYLRDNGARHDLIDAVLAIGIQGVEEATDVDASRPRSGGEATHVSNKNDDILMITRRVEALGKLLDTDDGTNLVAGYKRAANILSAEEKKGTKIADAIDAKLFDNLEERALFDSLEEIEHQVAQFIEGEKFEDAMSWLARLRHPVDAFFDKVMVNADDEAIRANRLALLTRIRTAMHQVADFSKIEG